MYLINIDIAKKNPNNGNYKAVLKFDGANGVGALKMKDMLPYFGSRY